MRARRRKKRKGLWAHIKVPFSHKLARIFNNSKDFLPKRRATALVRSLHLLRETAENASREPRSSGVAWLIAHIIEYVSLLYPVPRPEEHHLRTVARVLHRLLAKALEEESPRLPVLGWLMLDGWQMEQDRETEREIVERYARALRLYELEQERFVSTIIALTEQNSALRYELYEWRKRAYSVLGERRYTGVPQVDVERLSAAPTKRWKRSGRSAWLHKAFPGWDSSRK